MGDGRLVVFGLVGAVVSTARHGSLGTTVPANFI